MKQPDKIVGLDFETYFDTDYTLKKLSTSEYVRDERFEAISCAIRANNQRKTKVVFGFDNIRSELERYDWKATALLAHNTAFDGLILSHHFGHIPSYYYDTMSMARAIIDHSIGAGLDKVAKHLGFEGKRGSGRALDNIKGKRLADLTEKEKKELGLYNAQDVDVMWEIFREWEWYPKDELDLIHLSINAFANPILDADKPRIEKELKRAKRERNKLFGKVSELIDLEPAKVKIQKNKEKRELYKSMTASNKRLFVVQTALRSRDDFANALEKQGADVPRKISPSTQEETYAFAKDDLDFIALGNHPEENVRALYEAKLEANSSINITRAERLLQRVSKPGWRIPIGLNYCKAHTFRWSGGDKLNPQNFPARGRNGAELRRSIIPPRGYKIVVVDSSQIEARMNAWFWDHHELLDIFKESDAGRTKDPYCHQADKIYGYAVTKANETERFVGKTAVLGLGYGMGAPKFQYTLESGAGGPVVIFSDRQAKEAVHIYRKTNKPIVDGWYWLDETISHMIMGNKREHKGVVFDGEEVMMPNGLWLDYPQLSGYWSDWHGRYADCEYWSTSGHKPHWSSLYGGKFDENIIQSLSRIAVGQQMLRIAEEHRVVMMSHDEVVFIAPSRKAESALGDAIEHMRWTPDWCKDAPLNAEGKVADYYCK